MRGDRWTTGVPVRGSTSEDSRGRAAVPAPCSSRRTSAPGTAAPPGPARLRQWEPRADPPPSAARAGTERDGEPRGDPMSRGTARSPLHVPGQARRPARVSNPAAAQRRSALLREAQSVATARYLSCFGSSFSFLAWGSPAAIFALGSVRRARLGSARPAPLGAAPPPGGGERTAPRAPDGTAPRRPRPAPSRGDTAPPGRVLRAPASGSRPPPALEAGSRRRAARGRRSPRSRGGNGVVEAGAGRRRARYSPLGAGSDPAARASAGGRPRAPPGLAAILAAAPGAGRAAPGEVRVAGPGRQRGAGGRCGSCSREAGPGRRLLAAGWATVPAPHGAGRWRGAGEGLSGVSTGGGSGPRGCVQRGRSAACAGTRSAFCSFFREAPASASAPQISLCACLTAGCGLRLLWFCFSANVLWSSHALSVLSSCWAMRAGSNCTWLLMLKQKRNKQMHKNCAWMVYPCKCIRFEPSYCEGHLTQSKQTNKKLWEKMGQEGPFLPLSHNWKFCTDSKSNIKTPPHPAVLICCPSPEMMFPIVQSNYIPIHSQLLFQTKLSLQAVLHWVILNRNLVMGISEREMEFLRQKDLNSSDK